MGSVRFEPNSAGIRAALSQAGVQRAVNGIASDVCASACYMARGDSGAYAWHQGENSKVAIANVSTANVHGRRDNSKNHTLQKAAHS